MVDTSSRQSFEACHVSDVEDLTRPQLRPSIFPNVPPFINFLNPQQKYENFVRLEIPWNLWTACHNPLLIRCMVRAGFKAKQISEVSYRNMTGAIWDAIDSKTRFYMLSKLTNSPAKAALLLSESSKYKDLLDMNNEVKVNRLPGGLSICRKDELAKRHSKLANKFGSKEFNFVPETYSIPSEREKALERIVDLQRPDFPNIREVGGFKQSNLWIVKPCIRSGGDGIYLIDNIFEIPIIDEVKDVDQAIVQKYIANPLLINGHKFDMRLYVLITSVDPLMIYIYKDGLARFATQPYNTECTSIKNNHIHLTNAKVNKDDTEYFGEVGDPFSGFKWTLSMLQNYFMKEGMDWNLIWPRIEDAVRKTIILGYDTMKKECLGLKSRYNCYKLFGFDIMLDENLKPWVLEVNTDPVLFSDPVDTKLKSAMIAEMFNIVGFHIPNDIAHEKKDGLSKAYPAYKVVSHDSRLYERDATAEVTLNNAEMLECLESGQIEASELRLLIKAEEELSQTKNFIRTFPSASTTSYQRFFGDISHSDRFLQIWEQHKEIRENALEVLIQLCRENRHINQ